MSIKKFIIAIVILVIAISAYWVVDRREFQLGRQSEVEEIIPEPKIEHDRQAAKEDLPTIRSDGEPPREIVHSIYDNNLEYRQKAQAAAESYITPFTSDSIRRWRPVLVDPSDFLSGSYLDIGSVPETIQISPFPDISFTAVQSNYTIMESIESASWEGVIVGSDDGRIELNIVGGVDNPAFVIKIYYGPQIISISPTEAPDVYVAIEGNPFQPEPTL